MSRLAFIVLFGLPSLLLVAVGVSQDCATQPVLQAEPGPELYDDLGLYKLSD